MYKAIFWTLRYGKANLTWPQVMLTAKQCKKQVKNLKYLRFLLVGSSRSGGYQVETADLAAKDSTLLTDFISPRTTRN
jgi:hypothetical protein